MNKKTQVAILMAITPIQVQSMETTSLINTTAETERTKECTHEYRHFEFMGDRKMLTNETKITNKAKKRNHRHRHLKLEKRNKKSKRRYDSIVQNIMPVTERFKGCNYNHKYFDFIGHDFTIEKVLFKEEALKDRIKPLKLLLTLQSRPGKRVLVKKQAFANLKDDYVRWALECKPFVERIKERRKRLPKIKTHYVVFTKDLAKMFKGSSAEFIDLSGGMVSKKCLEKQGGKKSRHPNSMTGMFSGCKDLRRITWWKYKPKNVTNLDETFDGCENLEELNLNGFVTPNLRTMRRMCAGCESLEHMDISDINTSHVQNMSSMCLGCKSLHDVSLGNYTTDELQDASKAFKDCYSLKSIKLGSKPLKTKNVKNIEQMFENCHNLEKLNMSNFNTQNVKYLSNFISNCPKLHSVKYHPDAEERMLNAEKYQCKNIPLLTKKRSRSDESYDKESEASESEDKI